MVRQRRDVVVWPLFGLGSGIAPVGARGSLSGSSVWTADSSLLFSRSGRSASADRLYPDGSESGLAAGLVPCFILESRMSFFADESSSG